MLHIKGKPRKFPEDNIGESPYDFGVEILRKYKNNKQKHHS